MRANCQTTAERSAKQQLVSNPGAGHQSNLPCDHDEFLTAVNAPCLDSAVRVCRLAELISLDMAVDQLVQLALRELSEATRCRRCSMLLLNDELGDVLIESRDRPEGEDDLLRVSVKGDVAKFLVPARGEVTEHILRTRRPLVVQDTDRQHRPRRHGDRAYPAKAFASAPVLVGKRTVAILNATEKDGDQPISENDQHTMELFASQLALKLHGQVDDVENLFRRAYESLRLRAKRDGLQTDLDHATRTADRHRAQLSAIYVLSELCQSDFVLEELAKMIVKFVGRATGATRVSVLIIDEQKGDLLTRGGVNHENIVTQHLPHRGEVTEKVLRGKTSVLVAGSEDPSCGKTGPYQTDSYAVVPVFRGNNVEAVICATDKKDGSSFDKEDLRYLEVVAGQVAFTLTNCRVRERTIRQKTLERELHTAGEIQQNLFPLVLPDLESAELAACSRPAGFVGGDYYDVFDLSDERYAIVIADVSGKGMPAALVMVMISTFMRTFRQPDRPTGEIMASLNQYLKEHIEGNMFATMACFVFDAKERKLSYTNAGHNFPFLLREGDEQAVELTQSAFPLGVFEDAVFETETVVLQPGDLFLTFTDGLTDARNDEDQLFGTEAIIDCLTQHRHQSAEEIVNGLMAQIEQFAKGTEPYDDTTVIALKIGDGDETGDP